MRFFSVTSVLMFTFPWLVSYSSALSYLYKSVSHQAIFKTIFLYFSKEWVWNVLVIFIGSFFFLISVFFFINFPWFFFFFGILNFLCYIVRCFIHLYVFSLLFIYVDTESYTFSSWVCFSSILYMSSSSLFSRYFADLIWISFLTQEKLLLWFYF